MSRFLCMLRGHRLGEWRPDPRIMTVELRCARCRAVRHVELSNRSWQLPEGWTR